MKMTKILAIALASLLAFSSCEKTDLTVTLKQSGVLKVQLKNTNNEVIKDQKVKLYTYYSTGSSNTAFDSKKTDENGEVNFGELIEDIYYVVSEDVKIGTATYTVNKPVQVVTGKSDVVVINPEEYVGKLTLKVNLMDNNGSTSNTPVKKVNVALISYKDYNDTLTYAQALAKAVITAKTDDAGSAVFEKVPSNYEFRAFVYFADTAYDWASYNSSLYVEKDAEKTSTIYVRAGKILNLKSSAILTFEYYGTKGGNYGYWPVGSANVIAVDYNDYYNYNLSNASLSTIKSKKVAEGKTDLNGKITLKLPQSSSYYFLVYYSDTKKVWNSYSISIGTASYTSSIEVDESYLGLY